MADQARLERLTALAREAYPELDDVRARYDLNHDDWPEACVVYCAKHLEGCDAVLSEIRHPRSLDALEAALLALAGPSNADVATDEPFTLDTILTPEVLASVPADVRKLINAALSFEAGCITSMKHNCQRLREQCQREKARADAAERNSAKLARFIANLSSAACHIGAATKVQRFDEIMRLLENGLTT